MQGWVVYGGCTLENHAVELATNGNDMEGKVRKREKFPQKICNLLLFSTSQCMYKSHPAPLYEYLPRGFRTTPNSHPEFRINY